MLRSSHHAISSSSSSEIQPSENPSPFLSFLEYSNQNLYTLDLLRGFFSMIMKRDSFQLMRLQCIATTLRSTAKNTRLVRKFSIKTPHPACHCNSDLWDTAGQECFQTLHPSYYFGAHACILVMKRRGFMQITMILCRFLMLRERLRIWTSRPGTMKWEKTVQTFLASLSQIKLTVSLIWLGCVLSFLNPVDKKMTEKTFKFASQYNLPFYFVSAADGTNVVKVIELSGAKIVINS